MADTFYKKVICSEKPKVLCFQNQELSWTRPVDRSLAYSNSYAIAHHQIGSLLEKQLSPQSKVISEYLKARLFDPNHGMFKYSLQRAREGASVSSECNGKEYNDHQDKNKSLVDDKYYSTVLINSPHNGGEIGTGWVFRRDDDNTVWIVTNRHVISEKPTISSEVKVKVTFYQNRNYGNCYYVGDLEYAPDVKDDIDIAVVKVQSKDIPLNKKIQHFKIYEGTLTKESGVIKIIGNPDSVGRQWSVIEGNIINSDQENILSIDAFTAHGSSGSPVIKNGVVVGMVISLRTKDQPRTDPNKPSVPIKDNNVIEQTRGTAQAYSSEFILDTLRDWNFLK